MKNKLIAAALVVAAFAPEALALDLTPREITITEEGPPVQRYYFQDEARRLSFKIDNKMTVSGASSSATFRFHDLNTAGMKLSQSPFAPAMRFDEKNAGTYRDSARTFLPSDAVAVQLEKEAPDAIAINGWVSRQFTFSYTLFGVPYRSTVTFLNFSAEQQLVLHVNAAASDYAKAYARSYNVLNSIGELRATSKTGPT